MFFMEKEMNTQQLKDSIVETSPDRDTFSALLKLLQQWEPSIDNALQRDAFLINLIKETKDQIISLRRALDEQRAEIHELKQFSKGLTIRCILGSVPLHLQHLHHLR
jgi:hypothetical protein